jgi:hypothetical protein
MVGRAEMSASFIGTPGRVWHICDLIVIDERYRLFRDIFIKKQLKKAKLYILWNIKIVLLKKK